MRDFRNAVLAGTALVVFSLGLYSLAPDDPIGGYALLPGVIVGIYASVIASGNPHVLSKAVIVAVTCLVNCFFYTMVVYFLLRFYKSWKSKRLASNSD
jgi:hypothetical protein